MEIFNAVVDILVICVGGVQVAKYIVLYIVKGCIKFKFIKYLNNKIEVKEYIYYK